MKKNFKYFLIISPFIIILIFLTLKSGSREQVKTNISPVEQNNYSGIFSLNNDISSANFTKLESPLQMSIPTEYTVIDMEKDDILNSVLKKINVNQSTFQDLGNEDKLWKKDAYTVLYDNFSNRLDIQIEASPTYKSGFIYNQLIEQSKKIINDFIQIPYLEVNRVEYFTDDSHESDKGLMENSRIAKVGFIQVIPDQKFKIIPQNFVDNNTITLTIDSSLNPRFISINKPIKEVSKSVSNIDISLDQSKINKDLIHRITPFSIGEELTLDNSKNNYLEVKQAQVAYTQINSRLYPVYLITGDMYSNNKFIGGADFVMPVK